MPQRIQLSRCKGYHKPAGAIVVTRPGPWGNPFRVVRRGNHWSVIADVHRTRTRAQGYFASRLEAVEYAVRLHRDALRHLQNYPDSLLTHAMETPWRAVKILRSQAAHLPDLRGRDLACWCGEGPCHADVLLTLANMIAEAAK